MSLGRKNKWKNRQADKTGPKLPVGNLKGQFSTSIASEPRRAIRSLVIVTNYMAIFFPRPTRICPRSFLASFDKDHRGRCAHNGGNGINVGRRIAVRRGSMGYQVPNVIRFIRPTEYGAGVPTYIHAPGSRLKRVMRNSALGIGPRRGNRNAMEFVRITTRTSSSTRSYARGRF